MIRFSFFLILLFAFESSKMMLSTGAEAARISKQKLKYRAEHVEMVFELQIIKIYFHHLCNVVFAINFIVKKLKSEPTTHVARLISENKTHFRVYFRNILLEVTRQFQERAQKITAFFWTALLHKPMSVLAASAGTVSETISPRIYSSEAIKEADEGPLLRKVRSTLTLIAAQFWNLPGRRRRS